LPVFLRHQGQKTGALDRLRDLALMGGAGAGLFLGADLAGSGSEVPENLGVLEINRLDVFLTEIASHIFHKIRSTKFKYSKQFSNYLMTKFSEMNPF